MATVAIIGAGQLGSRHLQSLKMLDVPARVFVVEPRVESAENARQRWNEVSSGLSVPPLQILASTGELPSIVDVAIVSTTSRVRFQVLSELLQRRTVRFLVLEKVLFQDPLHYMQFRSLASACNVKTFVNCPRRLYTFYQELRELFRVSSPQKFEVVGGEWGLGCNSIHFMDLFAFLSPASQILPVAGEFSPAAHINSSSLDPSVGEAKRPGYVEFYGSISGELISGSGATSSQSGSQQNPQFQISSERGNPDSHVIRIHTIKSMYQIHEPRSEMIITDKESGTQTTRTIQIPLQSQLTQKVVCELLSSGRCMLTSFEQSQQFHLELLQTLLHHYRSHKDKNAAACPIT